MPAIRTHITGGFTPAPYMRARTGKSSERFPPEALEVSARIAAQQNRPVSANAGAQEAGFELVNALITAAEESTLRGYLLAAAERNSVLASAILLRDGLVVSEGVPEDTTATIQSLMTAVEKLSREAIRLLLLNAIRGDFEVFDFLMMECSYDLLASLPRKQYLYAMFEVRADHLVNEKYYDAEAPEAAEAVAAIAAEVRQMTDKLAEWARDDTTPPDEKMQCLETTTVILSICLDGGETWLDSKIPPAFASPPWDNAIRSVMDLVPEAELIRFQPRYLEGLQDLWALTKQRKVWPFFGRNTLKYHVDRSGGWPRALGRAPNYGPASAAPTSSSSSAKPEITASPIPTPPWDDERRATARAFIDAVPAQPLRGPLLTIAEAHDRVAAGVTAACIEAAKVHRPYMADDLRRLGQEEVRKQRLLGSHKEQIDMLGSDQVRTLLKEEVKSDCLCVVQNVAGVVPFRDMVKCLENCILYARWEERPRTRQIDISFMCDLQTRALYLVNKRGFHCGKASLKKGAGDIAFEVWEIIDHMIGWFAKPEWRAQSLATVTNLVRILLCCERPEIRELLKEELRDPCKAGVILGLLQQMTDDELAAHRATYLPELVQTWEAAKAFDLWPSFGIDTVKYFVDRTGGWPQELGHEPVYRAPV